MSNFSPWLLLLIGFIGGWFAQWLLELFFFRRQRSQFQRQMEESDGALQARTAELGAERSRNAALQSENEALRARLATPPPVAPETLPALASPVAEPAAAPTPWVNPTPAMAPVAAESGPTNELAAIAGLVEPWRSRVCEAGFCTLAALANATVTQLDAICQEPDHSRPDYASWILQAQESLAAEGSWTYDDLTALAGIDPATAALLNEQGFTNFRRLAAAAETDLAHAVPAPPWRDLRYSDWIAQARLAAAGDGAGLDAGGQRQDRRDNLQMIRNLDAGAAAALAAIGIDSFAALAAAAPDRLAAIVRAAGLPAGAADGWQAEALMRANGHHVRRAKREPLPAGEVEYSACPQYLAQVRGIGPLFERRLYEAGIGAYWEVANLPDEALARILAPRPWQQIDVAAIRRDAAQLAADSAAQGRVWDGSLPDDLGGIEGIGRMYEARLHEAGICTYQALAAATVEQLAAICRAPEWRRPDYGGWIAAAMTKWGGPTP
jgi:predicted flap endonuclease-1-like 5' DNA nuclease